MTPLLTEMFALPTGIFTVLMGLCVVYWLFVILGAIGVESLDFDLDGVLDGGVDGAVDGALDGALDGLDGADGVEVPSHSVAWHVVHALALDKAPATVVFSVLVLWCWVLSFVTMHFAAGSTAVPAHVVAALTFFAAIAGAVPLTNRSVRPLGRLFETQIAATRNDAIGVMCEVRTGRVTETFGQAEIRDGGAGLLIEVRCSEPNGLKRGDTALVVAFDRADEAYAIEPMDALVGDRHSSELDATEAAFAELEATVAQIEVSK